VGAAIAVLTTATGTISVQAAGAATTVQPPTISTQYTPSQIGVGQSSGITYTITNPNSSGTLYQVSFADSLPSTSTVDSPASVTSSGCGSAVSVAATPGAASVSASGIQVKAGTPCTISVAIAGNSAGTASDAYSGVLYTSSSASYAIPGPVPASHLTTATLQVLGAPTITTKSPKNKAKFAYGQAVKVSYGCAAGAGDDPTQLTCTASDDQGNTINSGQKLDTKVPGRHELDIQAISGLTGDTTDVTLTYTVLPDNAFTISKIRASKQALSFTLSLPGAGKVAVAEIAGQKTVAHETLTVHGRRTLTVTLKPPAGTVKLTVAYTPKGGVRRTLTKRGIRLG
jgi:hypothetical protein